METSNDFDKAVISALKWAAAIVLYVLTIGVLVQYGIGLVGLLILSALCIAIYYLYKRSG